MQQYFVLQTKMRSFLVFFVCVTLVSYYGTQGEDKTNESDLEDGEEGRRQFPGFGLNAAQAAAAAHAAANANGIYRPTQRPTAVPATMSKCYSCVDCPDVSKLPPNQNTCNAYNDPRCVTYVEKYSHLKKPLVIRGCVTERGTCDDIKRAHERQNVQLLGCDQCFGELCNSNGVARSLPDLTAALFFVVMTPVLTKYALS